MKKKSYDFVYLTNTPSFYKMNLCNEIAKTHSFLLVLYGYGSEAVNKELTDENHWNFDFVFIHQGDSNERNKCTTLWNLISLMRTICYKKILYAGWAAPEYNIFAFFSPKNKNVVVSESSIWDVSFGGIRGMIKKAFIGRMSAALPSGTPHAELFEKLCFKGSVNVTGGVGIFHRASRSLIKSTRSTPLRYLYVGRLIDVKNLKYLIDIFNKNGKKLTIVGKGEQESLLKFHAKQNITFVGFVANEQLGEIYRSHDIFILPSISETWGLVIDEALYWGLPVIVSNRVGAGRDLVMAYDTGVVFDISDVDGLPHVIQTVEENYDYYKENVDKLDFDIRDRKQVEAYTNLIVK